MGNYLKQLTFKGRINAHVYPWLHVIQVCLHPHTMTAKDKCSTKKQHRPKAEQTKAKKGNFSHWDKFIRWSTGMRLRILFKEKLEILTTTKKKKNTRRRMCNTRICAQCAPLITFIPTSGDRGYTDSLHIK